MNNRQTLLYRKTSSLMSSNLKVLQNGDIKQQTCDRNINYLCRENIRCVIAAGYSLAVVEIRVHGTEDDLDSFNPNVLFWHCQRYQIKGRKLRYFFLVNNYSRVLIIGTRTFHNGLYLSLKNEINTNFFVMLYCQQCWLSAVGSTFLNIYALC